jgi:hypothetical protein
MNMSFQATHGHCRRVDGKVHKSLTYQSWSSMNDRCYITTHKWYRDYGGRGIEVCEQWRRGTKGAFANFLEYMKERPNKQITLDRWPNVNGNYEPGNVQWATKAEQREHQRRNQPPVYTPPPRQSTEDALVAGMGE